MNRRVVRLIERRTRAVRLPRAEVDFLLAHARHLIELAPTFERGTYWLTPRGCVGFLDGPTCRYAIRPKIPWPNLCVLLGVTNEPKGDVIEPEGGLLAGLASEFAERLEAVVRAGLVAGYGEAQTVSTFLRGRLRTADQMRDVAARAFPDRFHIDEPVFDLQTPWNRISKATVTALLRRELPTAIRHRMEAAALPLAGVSDALPSEADFNAALTEPRAANYRPLLELCQLILGGFATADVLGANAGGFLLDLGAAFERYLTQSLAREFASSSEWRMDARPTFALGPTALQPDIVIHNAGSPRCILDAKWKLFALEPSDIHQILAYATLTGARHVGLVYPGRRWRRVRFTTPDGRVSVSRFRVRVVGTTAELVRSITKLARAVRGGGAEAASPDDPGELAGGATAP